MKNDQVAKFDVQASGLFLPIDSHFGQIVRYGLQICFASIYSNFDIQTNFEVSQTEVIHSISINTPKNH